jgi:hypothetical protein
MNRNERCPLCPRKRTFLGKRVMAASDPFLPFDNQLVKPVILAPVTVLVMVRLSKPAQPPPALP